jgi:hypothetical protein
VRFRAALARIFSVQAGVVSATDDDMAALVPVADRNRRPAFALPAAMRCRHLDAMVDRVAHQVRQRIDDALDQALVESAVAPLVMKSTLPSFSAGQVAHHAREGTRSPSASCGSTSLPSRSSRVLRSSCHR